MDIMLKNLSPKYYPLLLIAFALLIFVPGIGETHLFDWDEINFAECAREMILTGDYLQVQIDFYQFWEKPPLFIWLQAISMQLLGVNEFAARLPNTILGAFTLWSLYWMGKRLKNERFGLIWALAYAGSFLPHFYFKSGIIDPFFNILIFYGVFYLSLFYKTEKPLHLVISGVFIGLSVLTKGPVGLLIYGLTYIAYYVWHWRKLKFPIIPGGSAILVVLATAGIWFLVDYINNGPGFLVDFITYQIRLLQTQDAGHGGPFYYHFIVLLIGCFPLSVFALPALKTDPKSGINVLRFHKWMLCLFWAVLILFSIVNTKIVHYSSMCYLPLSFLAATYIDKLIRNKAEWTNKLNISFWVIGSILAVAITLLPILGINLDAIAPYVKDQFALGNFHANVRWSYAELSFGIILFILIFLSSRLLRNKQIEKACFLLFATLSLYISVVVIHFTPKIEGYSQNAAIRFYESKVGEDCYIQVFGFKSYAHLFYSKKQIPSGAILNIKQEDRAKWKLRGNIDKPVYFLTKNTHPSLENERYGIVKTGEKNGFVFYERRP